MGYSRYGRELVFVVVAHDNGPQRNPRFETFVFDRRNRVRAFGYGQSLQESLVDLAADWPDGKKRRTKR